MFKNKRILRGIILGALLICTAFIVYSIIINPFEEHSIMLPLAVSAAFVVLGETKLKQTKKQNC